MDLHRRFVRFNETTLAKLHNATAVAGISKAHYICAVDGIRWEDEVVQRNKTALPCGPENLVSR